MTTDKRQQKIAACRVEASGDGWNVTSPSGSTYRVTSESRIDRGSGSLYFVRHCDCPARVRECVHAAAVEQHEWTEAANAGDYETMDVLERTS